MPWMFTDGIMGDKKKMRPDKLNCPWKADCPSHKPYTDALKPKVKLIERVQPKVYLYECKYCGMRFLQDVTNPEKSAPALEKTTALVGGNRKWGL